MNKKGITPLIAIILLMIMTIAAGAGAYYYQSQQARAPTEAINIASNLFKTARADYMEVLMTQRDALNARMELVETKKLQMNAMVNIYRSLGGGWR